MLSRLCDGVAESAVQLNYRGPLGIVYGATAPIYLVHETSKKQVDHMLLMIRCSSCSLTSMAQCIYTAGITAPLNRSSTSPTICPRQALALE